MATTSADAASSDRSFFGHPRGLAVLFLTEMWERFSFYGMRALLVLYLTQHFLFGDREAQGLYAAYASLVYLAPVLGGWVADRYLGSRKAVTIGALLLVAGHFGMAFEGSGSRQYIDFGGSSYELVADGRGEDRALQLVTPAGERLPASFSAEGLTILNGTTAGLPAAIPAADLQTRTVQQPLYVQILFFSLSLIIVGVGFLKANISTIVGALYEPGDPRRDGGFTIFYMGINLGSVLATWLCAWLGIAYGWAYGFGLAGFGMLAGLVTFLAGQKWLGGRAEPPNPAALRERKGPLSLEWLIYVGGFIMLLPAWFLVQRDELVTTLLTWGAPIILLGMLGWSLFALRGIERSRMVVALILITFTVLFWTLFEQAGSSLTLYADRNTDLTIVGDLRMNAAQVQLFNPLFIVLLAPVFAGLWTWLGKRGIEPSTPVKFALALAQVGLGFLVLVIGINTAADSDFRVPLIWLALAYLLHTTGEICLSPVGLSMITKLAVPRVVGLMMGVWFLASALAHTLAGLVAQATSSDTVGGVVVDPGAALSNYASVFTQIGWAGVIVGGVLLLLSPLLKRWMAMPPAQADHAMAGESQIGESAAAGTDPRGETRA
ncbi:peptide MFS transporter [Sphingomonas baiyangensis]|uniref:Peptide MFS transporter n=1 Tax=Sphingomonas baiyangensis TaxID=2572576 RepID=A0A4U1L6I9_9SPHN|nr:peptide MFS transporter [Sphingomonas baiyangensis]TKD51953.1 peptide MFS transporter [Sphingomonas baiyangensis]